MQSTEHISPQRSYVPGGNTNMMTNIMNTVPAPFTSPAQLQRFYNNVNNTKNSEISPSKAIELGPNNPIALPATDLNQIYNAPPSVINQNHRNNNLFKPSNT
eukprot:UN18970